MNDILTKINKMAIIDRKDGRKMGSMTVQGTRKSFYGSTKAEVKNKAKDYLLKIEGGYKEPKKILFGEYMEMWLMKYKYGKIEPSSFTRLYRVYDCQIKDGIGKKKIGDITTEMIQNLIDEHANPTNSKVKPLAKSGLKRLIQIIRPCLERAVKDGIIQNNPTNDVIIPSESYIQKETREQITLSDEQIETFKTAALQKYKNGEYKSRDALVLLVILNLGLRAGEALALKWTDIDFGNKMIQIKSTVQSNIMNLETKKTYDRIKRSTKSKAGIRMIKLNDNTIFYLNELRQYDKRKKNISQYIASTSTGTIPNYRNLTRSLKRVIKDTDLPKEVTLHTLRHTFGSTLLRKGVQIEIVSKLMGHANIMITYNKYIHVLQAQQIQAMEMITIA